jgi:copper transport protein
VARRRLIAAIRIEIGLVVLVLAVVSLWRFTPPPRALDATLGATPGAATLHAHRASTSFAVHFHDERIKAQLDLNLDSDGHGQARIAVQNADGTPSHPQQVTLQLGNAADAVETFSLVAVPDKTGQWKVDSLTIPIAGNWEVGLDVLISDFDQVHLLEHVRIPYPAH